MRFELFKILDKQYLDSFIAGNLYMNSLEYFRKLEGNEAQIDWGEGLCGTIHKNQLRQLGYHFPPDLHKLMGDMVPLRNDYYGLNNIFCLYRLSIDDSRKILWRPDEQIYKFNDTEDRANKIVARITNMEQFLQRLECAVHAGLARNRIEYSIYGNVIYSNAWDHADGPGTRSAFHKDPSYAYQNEWRFCILRHTFDENAFQFSVGDLSDIIQVISFEQFASHPESLYPNYTTATEPQPQSPPSFRISGTINTVNHLMFSYFTPSVNTPVRSDKAQAAWHYAQYLNLRGTPEEIDTYLESRFKEVPDLDHLQLLVQHRLSSDEWVRATDIFYYCIKESPSTIAENPNTFCLNLHTILMQHQQAADAAKFYKIMENSYPLDENLKMIMMSDFLFALGFYDKAIPLFLKMQESSPDPIFDYNLAVAYLHTLDFDQAYRHLQQYTRYFSHSVHNTQMTERLRIMIEGFYHDKPLSGEPKAHPFSSLEWPAKLESALSNTKRSSIYIGIDSLYLLEKDQKWGLIEKFSEIIVCPMTIARLIELYGQSRDPIFFRILKQISQFPQLQIRSPELDYYLAVDVSAHTENMDLPPYILMERALYLQEQQRP